jgi:hypothetical protein
MSGTIDGSGALVKAGGGTLILAGPQYVDDGQGGSTYRNTYAGGTVVAGGALIGNMAEGLDRDLTVSSGATYHGAGLARTIGQISGGGVIRGVGGGSGSATSGLTVAGGEFSGRILDTPLLTKVAAPDPVYDDDPYGTQDYTNYTSSTTASSRDPSTLILTGKDAFSGSIALQSGTIKVSGAGTVTPTKLTMWGGTTFDVSEATAYDIHTDSGLDPTKALLLQNLVVGQPVGSTVYATAYPVTGATLWTAPKILGDVRIMGSGHDPLLNSPAITYNVPNGIADGATLLTVDGSVAISEAVIRLAGNTRNLTRLKLVDVLSSKDITASTDPEKAADYADNTGTYDLGTMTLVLESETGERYELQVDGQDPNDLVAVLKGINPDGPTYERMKSYAEGRLAALALVNQGQDYIIDKGMAGALAATAGQGLRMGAFGTVDGGRSRYTTGSHIDLSSQTMLAGIGVGGDTAFGRLAVAAFFEAGQGSHTTQNDFGDAKSVHGKGNTNFYGGGILARLDTQFGMYIEASGRVGRSELDYSSGDLLYAGVPAKFDTDALYFGGHGGVGHVMALPGMDGKGTLDISAKILWTHMDEADVVIVSDSVHFRRVDSVRLRGGARFNYAFTNALTGYGGAHWEHEFAAAQGTVVNGASIKMPSLGGHTIIGEAGVSYRPTESMPLFIDLGGQVYVGQRQGYGGSLQVRLEY